MTLERVLLSTFVTVFSGAWMTSSEVFPPPLCKAVQNRDSNLAMKLIGDGADVNAGSGCALFAAAGRGELALAKELLAHGADPNGRASGDASVVMGAESPLQAAVQSRKTEMVVLLLDSGAEPSDFAAFDVVLNFGDVAMAEQMLNRGANPNLTRPAGQKVYAYPDGKMTEVPQSDLSPDRIDATAKRLDCTVSTRAQGTSILHLSIGPGTAEATAGRARIVKLLIDRGADPNSKTLNGTTPLMYAASQYDLEAMSVLLAAGADGNAQDRCGRTALNYVDQNPRHQRAHLAPKARALLPSTAR